MMIEATDSVFSEQLVRSYLRAFSPETKRAIASELFEVHYERVARWCYRFVGDREAAADIAQDVFLKAHLHLDSFKGNSRFTTWLYSITRNECLTYLQRRSPVMVDADEELIDVPSLDPAPDEVAAQNSRTRRVYDFLAATLGETELTVFTLHYGEDVPLDAITRLLGLENASGAKAYIVSARRKLARATRRLHRAGSMLSGDTPRPFPALL